MGDNNDDIVLNDVPMAQPDVAEQNELIIQVMQ